MKTSLYFNILLIGTVLLSCSKQQPQYDSYSGQTTGMGGSMARFTITNDHLYTVSETEMNVFDIGDANNPVAKKKMNIGWGVETIFPLNNNLFLGTQTGMKIMDVTNPLSPVELSEFRHIRSCDPVVANGQYAYVTLRTDNMCTRGTNELQIIDINNLSNPILIKSYPLNQPKGLSLDGNDLFVCDNMIKWYDVSDPQKLVIKSTTAVAGTDVIARDGILMVIGPGGLSQYSYDTGELKLLSQISTTL